MKKASLILILLCFFVTVQFTFADTDSETKFKNYPLVKDSITVDLPESWFLNTPDNIDDKFLEVTENSSMRLKNYLSNKYIKYNLVSKDLSREIDVIVIHNSRSKLLFNFNSLDEKKLKKEAKLIIDQGKKTDDNITTSYDSYEIKSIGKCKYMILNGQISNKDGKYSFQQYTTMVNGYCLTFSIRINHGDDVASSEQILSEVVQSVNVSKVLATNYKKNIASQVLPAVLLALAIVAYITFLIIHYVRKKHRLKK